VKPSLWLTVCRVMEDAAPLFAETPVERSARYWKKAANCYHQACTCETFEVRAACIDMAMAWAALAAELERAPTALPLEDNGRRVIQ